MAMDHRLDDHSGSRINFSCENKRYHTNINKGFQHGSSSTRGSAFPQPLINHGYTLWLEHVVEKKTGDELYWLMWYNQVGVPTIPMSGVFDRKELSEMTRQLANFIP